MSGSSDELRPVGMLEKLYTARQVVGVYNSVIVTATYTVPSDLQDNSLYTILSAAIPGLLHRHPSLCCYFEGENTPEPTFRRLKSIKVADVLQIIALGQRHNFTQELQELHDQKWSAAPNPLWKLVVMREQHGSSMDSTLHLAFVYHHVIGDGLSGAAFHRSLIHQLANNNRTSHDGQVTSTAVTISSALSLPEPIERLVSLPLSWPFLAKHAFQEYAPPWLIGAPSPLWAALPAKAPDECPLRSRVRLVNISADEVQHLLKESKKHGVTLTSLLTAAIVFALADNVPEASRFLGITPYTLRRVTRTSMDEMVNQSSAFETDYPAEILDRIRRIPNATERVKTLWDTAGYFYTQMQRELAKCPRDNLMGLLPYVSDYIAFYSKKFGRAREATFEVSNLGVVETSLKPLPQNWRLENMTFTQGAQPVGSALTVNCVSVQDGPLSVAITWQDSIVHEDIIDAVAHGFAELAQLLQHDGVSGAANI
ncbi:MAG: hypothetical protein L6R40_003715 [Gallowayella cf. fulva]|nr:MAG: hypothetical protein L6R40_003715 [Xanthomendoza cf. fulva]